MNAPCLNLNEPRRIDNAGVSDLWFNHNHDEYAPREGVRDDYDLPKMLDEAAIFSSTLQIAGIEDAPAAAELVEDFFARV